MFLKQREVLKLNSLVELAGVLYNPIIMADVENKHWIGSDGDDAIY